MRIAIPPLRRKPPALRRLDSLDRAPGRIVLQKDASAVGSFLQAEPPPIRPQRRVACGKPADVETQRRGNRVRLPFRQPYFAGMPATRAATKTLEICAHWNTGVVRHIAASPATPFLSMGSGSQEPAEFTAQSDDVAEMVLEHVIDRLPIHVEIVMHEDIAKTDHANPNIAE